MTNEKANRRALWMLAVGGTVGVLLGVATALHERGTDRSTLPNGAIALVNGRPIREEDFARAVALVEGDKRTAVTAEDRAHVLDRLIEEELLIQRGIGIGLVDSNRSVRKAITQAMLASIVAESASARPSEDELRAFYAEHPLLFVHSAAAAADQGVATGQAREPRPFEDIREQVEAAYLRSSRDGALQEYLEWLRDEATITLAPEVRK
jgi:hypothetical protein